MLPFVTRSASAAPDVAGVDLPLMPAATRRRSSPLPPLSAVSSGQSICGGGGGGGGAGSDDDENKPSKRRSSLREVLVDRAATLFPSMLILTFGLLIILHLSSPSFQLLTHVYTIPATARMAMPSTTTNPQVHHSSLISELAQWKDPNYASSKLRVYFYDLPPQFNTELVSMSHSNPPKIRDPYCDESFYSAEHTIAEHFRHSAVRTYDPDDAHFFYVPIYTTCYLLTHLPNDVNRTGAFFSRGMDIVINEYPFWNRSDGRDHVFMFAQGFGARLSGEWERYRHATFLVHNGDYSESHFSTHKDIVIPPDLTHYLTPVALQSPDKLLSKRFFVLFGGQVLDANISDHRGSNYSGGVRQFVASTLANTDGYRITGVRSTTYIDDMTKSVFCLSPHGWHKWSPRPAYAVLLGCIPVVVSEQQALFLENLLDYTAFSYWVKPGDIRKLDEKLRAISPAELAKRERNLRDIWPLFWYDDKEGLAKQAVMYSLFRRIHAVKSERHFL